MTDEALRERIEEAYRDHRKTVWGLCYQFTGSKSDAEELAQRTFVRLSERPPEDLDRSLRGWLLRVAANLARDRLRKRKRADYTGPWLPAPVRDGDVGAIPGFELDRHSANPETRYEQLESVRYGFLVALEELTPNQRSVLLLRDVYDLSVRETAKALEMTESNVRVTHHRARERLPADPEAESRRDVSSEATRRVLDELMEAIVQEDHERLRSLFTEDVRLRSDGGEYASATRPLEGPDRVIAFLLGLRANGPSPDRVVPVDSNAGTTLVVEFDDPPARRAPRLTIQADLEAGTIGELFMVMAPEKVAHLEMH